MLRVSCENRNEPERDQEHQSPCNARGPLLRPCRFARVVLRPNQRKSTWRSRVSRWPVLMFLIALSSLRFQLRNIRTSVFKLGVRRTNYSTRYLTTDKCDAHLSLSPLVRMFHVKPQRTECDFKNIKIVQRDTLLRHVDLRWFGRRTTNTRKSTWRSRVSSYSFFDVLDRTCPQVCWRNIRTSGSNSGVAVALSVVRYRVSS